MVGLPHCGDHAYNNFDFALKRFYVVGGDVNDIRIFPRRVSAFI